MDLTVLTITAGKMWWTNLIPLLHSVFCLFTTVNARHGSQECCEGMRQSPIDIDLKNIVSTPDVQPISMYNYDDTGENVTVYGYGYDKWFSGAELKNYKGHTVMIEVPKTEHFAIELDYVPNVAFKLWQVHFHWGENETEGAEHKLSGSTYPLEIHFVHYRESKGESRVSSFGTHENSLTVLGVFGHYVTCHEQSKTIQQLYRNLDKVLHPEANFQMSFEINLADLLPSPEQQRTFFYYNGSLTTTPYTETANWIVFPTSIPISPCFVRKLRRILKQDKTPLTKNFRLPQPLHNRHVLFTGRAPPDVHDEASQKLFQQCKCERKHLHQVVKQQELTAKQKSLGDPAPLDQNMYDENAKIAMDSTTGLTGFEELQVIQEIGRLTSNSAQITDNYYTKAWLTLTLIFLILRFYYVELE